MLLRRRVTPAGCLPPDPRIAAILQRGRGSRVAKPRRHSTKVVSVPRVTCDPDPLECRGVAGGVGQEAARSSGGLGGTGATTYVGLARLGRRLPSWCFDLLIARPRRLCAHRGGERKDQVATVRGAIPVVERGARFRLLGEEGDCPGDGGCQRDGGDHRGHQRDSRDSRDRRGRWHQRHDRERRCGRCDWARRHDRRHVRRKRRRRYGGTSGAGGATSSMGGAGGKAGANGTGGTTAAGGAGGTTGTGGTGAGGTTTAGASGTGGSILDIDAIVPGLDGYYWEATPSGNTPFSGLSYPFGPASGIRERRPQRVTIQFQTGGAGGDRGAAIDGRGGCRRVAGGAPAGMIWAGGDQTVERLRLAGALVGGHDARELQKAAAVCSGIGSRPVEDSQLLRHLEARSGAVRGHSAGQARVRDGGDREALAVARARRAGGAPP